MKSKNIKIVALVLIATAFLTIVGSANTFATEISSCFHDWKNIKTVIIHDQYHDSTYHCDEFSSTCVYKKCGATGETFDCVNFRHHDYKVSNFVHTATKHITDYTCSDCYHTKTITTTCYGNPCVGINRVITQY